MSGNVQITGLDEIVSRMRGYPTQLNRAMRKTMDASLLKIWEIVGNLGYPPRFDSDYVRTGTLGRSIGTGIQGGQVGRPDIYRVTNRTGGYEGAFGTRLGYAGYVIGEGQQAWMHAGVWWTLERNVRDRAEPAIIKLFQIMSEEVARWLDGSGRL